MSGYERNISDAFLESLEEGILEPLLTRVRKDDFLNLEFRGDEIHVYHRGGVLLKASENGVSQPQNYRMILNNTYLSEEIEKIEVGSRDDVKEVLGYLPRLKDAMELHFDTINRYEKVYSQQMIRMNNYPEIFQSQHNNSDYYIIDFEARLNGYINKDEAEKEIKLPETEQSDLIGVRWPAHPTKERWEKNNDNLILTIFELKFGNFKNDNSEETSNLKKHFEKVQKMLEFDHFNFNLLCKDAKKIFRQKRKLGLIDCGHDIGSINKDRVDYAVCLFDYNQEQAKLKNVIKKLNDQYENMNTDKISLKIVRSSLMGAALKKYNVMSPEKAMKSISI